MDSAMSISNPQTNHQYPTEHTLDLGINVNATGSGSTSEEPAKRRPGRPKGSTKKNLLGTTLPSSKVKRPVGRPRKDGMPAGSVGPTRQKRERQATAFFVPQGVENGFQGVAYPPTMGMYPPPPVPFVGPSLIPIDPSLSGDEWSTLARNDPNGFLGSLLAALAAPNPVSNAGPSVEEAFKSHLLSLAPTPNQVQQIPSLYSILKTFWLPSSPAYFSLTASASTARTPSEHRFLYWDPLPLVFNGIGCPVCNTPLVNKGRISSGPVKVYDIEKPFFIIGCEYVCKNSPSCLNGSAHEGRKFASTDSSIIRSLPAKLKDEFPAKLLYDDTDAGCGPNIWNWKALGVSWSLWNMVIGALRMGLKREVILHLIHSIQNGVPDSEPSKLETEESQGSTSGQEGAPPQSQDGSVQHRQEMDQPEQQPFAENYSDAWKEQPPSAVPESPVKAPAPIPSTSHAQPPTSTPVASPPAAPPFYQAYPFAPYGYMPAAHMVNGQVVALAPGSVSAGPHEGPGAQQHQQQQQQSEQTTGATSKRSPRHCCKCGSQECKGKGGRNFCVNACQDCGKLDCKGRNSRRPDKKCSEGWT